MESSIKFVHALIVCAALNLSIKNLIKGIDVAVSTALASQIQIKMNHTSIDIKNLADMLGLHPDTVRKSLKRLQAAKFLQITHRIGRSNVYTFTYEGFTGIDKTNDGKMHISSSEKNNEVASINIISPSRNYQELSNSNSYTVLLDDVEDVVERCCSVKSSELDNSRDKANISMSGLLQDYSKSDLISALMNYLDECVSKGCDEIYRLNCSNFFSPEKMKFVKYLPASTNCLDVKSEYSCDQLDFISNSMKNGGCHVNNS